MKPIYIFRHQEYEGPGYLQQFLHHHHIPYQIIYIDQGEAIPHTIDQCSALVFMGGPMSVNDSLPWIDQELALIRAAVENNMPVLGHCLGGQLIAKALGAKVYANGIKEIGWFAVEKLANTQSEDWLPAVPQTFDVFHWHGETFSLPSGATNILQSEHCQHQAFVLGNTLAMQCHIEMTEEMVQQWTACYQQELVVGVPAIQSANTMVNNLAVRIKQLQSVAHPLYRRWLQPLIGN